MDSGERVADDSLSLHDYPFSPAALDAIALQRVYAALDLTRSRRTLYPSTSSSSWGRSCTASLRDVRAARPPADDRRSFRVGHVSGRRTLGAGPHLASLPLLGNSSSGGGSRRVASATVRAHVGVAFRRAPMSTHCATPATSTPPARATRGGIGCLDSGVCWRLHRPCAVNRSESGRTTRRRHRPPHEHDRFGSRGTALGQVQALSAVVADCHPCRAHRGRAPYPESACRWLPLRSLKRSTTMVAS